MSEVYVLMEDGWEYNDEIRFRPESRGGTPRKVFTSKKKAQEECDALNVKEFKSLFASGEITEYFYSWDDLLPYRERKNTEFQTRLNKVCEKIFGMDFEQVSLHFDNRGYREGSLPGLATATDKNWLEFLSCTTLHFWEVVTVEKGK